MSAAAERVYELNKDVTHPLCAAQIAGTARLYIYPAILFLPYRCLDVCFRVDIAACVAQRRKLLNMGNENEPGVAI